MDSAMTVLTIVGGLVFSVSCALLVEELIFGGLFRFFFQPRQTHETRPWFVGSADKPVPVPAEAEKPVRKLKK